MKMRWIVAMSVLFGLSSGVLAMEKQGKKFEDSMKSGDKQLVLNGLCLRKVRKFGIPIKVYVGGLYVSKKSGDAAELLSGPNPKVVRLVFLRSVDGSRLEEAWTEALGKNCDVDCDQAKAGLKEFNKMMSDVREDTKIEVAIQDDGLDVDAGGKDPHKGAIKNAAFAKNFLKIFIGKEPPTEDCKQGFLGQEK